MMCGNGFHHGAGCSRHRLPFLKCLGPCLRLEDPLCHPSQGAGRLRPSQPAQTSGDASHHTSFLPQPLRDPAPAVALAGISSPGRQFRGHGKQVGPSSRSLQRVAGGKAQKVALLGASTSHSPCSASCDVWLFHILGGLLHRSPSCSNPTAPFLLIRFQFLKYHLALSRPRLFAQALVSAQNVFSLPTFFLLYLVIPFHIPSLILNAPSQL